MDDLKKSTSEIWVTSLGGPETKNSKANSEKLIKHYSKLSEIFTKF